MCELLIYVSAGMAVVYAGYILISQLAGKRKECKKCGKCE